MKIEQSVSINRPVEQVWQFISNVENAPQWDRGVLAARFTSDGPPRVGATIEIRRRFFGRERVGKIQITEYQPPHRVAFQAKLGQATAAQQYIFEPHEDGTRLIQAVELELHGWWKWIAPLLVRMLERDGREDLANLKHILENTSAGKLI